MHRSQLDATIAEVLTKAPDTSDILFTVGKPIQAEVHGRLTDVPTALLSDALVPFQVESVGFCMMLNKHSGSLRLFQDLQEQGSCDLSYDLPGFCRFRVNIFFQQGSASIVMRKMPSTIPTLKDLNLPPLFDRMADEKYGLILLTGGTGTGKSTTLAALIDAINERHSKHILTLEDPVEFVHHHKRGTVNQREMGTDFDRFSSGLRAALRQAPKVILVGEIRDRETIEIALQASETGHLVLGTLHTSDTGQTINRIIGMFELAEERLIRQRLSQALKYVVSQRLMPRIGGGRVAALEVLTNTLRIKELIINGESGEKTFYNVVESGDAYGMFTFDQHLARLYSEEAITEETAMNTASDRSRLGQTINRVKTLRGEKVTNIEGLELDTNYDQRNSDF
ncbi:type IV pilus twitching motility protein PilT [Desulfonatronum lacustre]|uniref:type IV pilus twitching motility protein PilT n=1 Tax=Desulfonatronum lacustre TaxID=66849 RepID=UPI0004912086|nr:PilT/PilU family type 4a pilus ATPase [Desulfonatronum lacustre]SMP68510.1 twitching motility protein PilT [Desulfonatronum zhilinae]